MLTIRFTIIDSSCDGVKAADVVCRRRETAVDLWFTCQESLYVVPLVLCHGHDSFLTRLSLLEIICGAGLLPRKSLPCFIGGGVPWRPDRSAFLRMQTLLLSRGWGV